ncbi:MAG: hypothetical protein LBO74_02055 [Candidatus Symbiothrix sp.]|jgi:hypothetical protein|nr:hypothetical protein [Candidatus Symbiothrix sp.]
METKSKIQEKRDYLKALSQGLKVLKKEGAIETINEGLKALYAERGHLELKTLNQWNKVGKRIKKGETALLLWAQPKKITPNPKNQTNPENQEDEMNFYPICFVFSNKQIQEVQ